MAGARSTDVAIIGGGIAGCASAYYLAKKGLSVVLLEKGEIAGEQSGRNWGFVRQQRRDPQEIPLMMACNRLWQGLEAELEANIEWRRGGLLYLAGDEAELARYEVWLEHAKLYQLDSRLVTGAEAAELLPGMARRWPGGLYTPSDGQADPVKTTRAFAAAARRLGAELREGCLVEAIETAAGAVVGLRGEAGTIRAGTVLLAAGVWSSALLRRLGLDLPQLSVRATVLRSEPAPAKTALGVWSPLVGFRQRRDGSFNLALGGQNDHEIGLDTLRHLAAFWPGYRKQQGATRLRLGRRLVEDLRGARDGEALMLARLRRDRVLDPPPDKAKAARALENFRALLPEFAGLRARTTWAGMIEATPDELPVFGAVPGLRGLVVATGFSGHGFGMGPITGTLMAELIAVGRTSLDISALAFERFARARRGAAA